MRPTKREKLLDTAERVFYEEGFHATGIDRVVAEAGVARMTLYNHFPSKDALVVAVLARRQERYLDGLRSAVSSRGGSAVHALADAHFRWLESTGRRGCLFVMAMGEFERHDTVIHEQALGFKRAFLKLIDEALGLDGLGACEKLPEQIFLILEGTNPAVPVLGAERTRRYGTALLDAAIAQAGGRRA